MNLQQHNPYPSTRLPLFARNVVSTSHPLAAQAGLRMLLKGGNAIDAAIATAAALTVVEPCSNGLGSDNFAIVWDGERLHGMNSSGLSPTGWSTDYFERKHGGQIPLRGFDAVTVPGAVGGWAALSERFGIPAEGGVQIDLKLTNDDLASIAGVSRQFVNSTLQDLRKRGVIAGRRHSVVVARPDRLLELAHRA